MSALTRGIVLSQTGSELIIQATDADVIKFGRAALVSVIPGVPTNTAVQECMEDGLLYDRYGRPIAHVRDVSYHRSHIDVTHFGSPQNTYLQGCAHYEIRGEGPVR